MIKKIFSRFSFVALTIIFMFLLSVAVFIAAFYGVNIAIVYFFPKTEWAVRVGIVLIDWLALVIAVLHAANRDMVPETKIPWIVCIIALNILGVAMYLVFSSNRPGKRARKQYALLLRNFEPYHERALGKEETEAALGRWADTSEALASYNAVLHANTKTEYFPSGEEYAERLIGDLSRAETYIFMEFFIIAKGKLWSRILETLKERVAAGVEVRLMYDDIGCMGKVHMRYHKTLRKLGIKCVKFNPFVPVVANIHNNRDHRKIVVIDGKIGYTGGINLADEYVNLKRPFGHWKDTAVRLEGEGVRNLTLMFLHLYDLQRRISEDVFRYLPSAYERFEGEGYVQPYGDGPRPLYERQIGEDVYLNILSSAKKSVWITTPYLIIDYRMREALVLAAQRGVDVRIVTPHIPDKKIPFALTRSNYMALIKGGVKIYEYLPGFIHAKSFLADGEAAVVGTINLDYRSLLFHFEDAVFMYRTKAVKQLEEDFERTFAQSALQTEADAKKSVVWRGICEIAKLFAPLF